MEVLNLSDNDYKKQIGATEKGLVLFHKNLCPHCLNMKKVIDKFIAAASEDVAVMYMDSEENPEGMKNLNIERVPTLAVIKDGKVAVTKTGLMNPRELAVLYRDA